MKSGKMNPGKEWQQASREACLTPAESWISFSRGGSYDLSSGNTEEQLSQAMTP
jgi:hypothetical protein